MKKNLVFVCLVALFFLTIGSANATPVDYAVGSGSSVTLAGNTATTTSPDIWIPFIGTIPGQTLGTAEITGELLAGLGDLDGTILDGHTAVIDFFTLTVNTELLGSGGTYQISAVLDLDVPDVQGTGSGSGLFGSVAGIISGGTLFWDSMTLPDVFTLADGNVLSVDFENGIDFGLGNTATVHAYLTNHGGASAPVPEPSTMLLMGLGLAGLVGYTRKRSTK